MKTTKKNGLLNRLAAFAAVLVCAFALTACGGGGGSPGGETAGGGGGSGGATASSVELTASTSEILSAGAAGTEAVITVLVKDSGNNVLPGVNVTLTASSGSLSNTNRVTNAQGVVTERLGIGGNPTTRAITVTASAPGVSVRTLQVNVVGTTLTINASNSANLNSATEITVSLKDSAGNNLGNKPVSFSSARGNTLIKSGGGASPQTTNSSGQLVLSYTALTGGIDTITVSALGETASKQISINSTNFFVTAVETGTQNTITEGYIGNNCVQVRIHNDNASVGQSGSVNLSTSRGAIYSDAACTLQNAITMTNGEATAYVKSTYPGIAMLTAQMGGASAQNTFEFIAPLGLNPQISLQAMPAAIGVNSGSSTSQQSTISATVRDASNNLVKSAPVTFTITRGGGYLTSPSSNVLTGSDGVATVNYVAGTTTSGLDGVTIQGQINGTSEANTVDVTVGAQTLSITAGTGNRIIEHDAQTYRKDYVVFATDAAGQPVPGATVNPLVRAITFYKGYWTWVEDPPPAGWAAIKSYECNNEDTNGNGIIEAGEDVNGNNILEPQIPMSIQSAGATDQNGMTTVSLYYPRDRAVWTDVRLTIRGSAAGTEAQYVTVLELPILGDDISDQNVSPPQNPYGSHACTSVN